MNNTTLFANTTEKPLELGGIEYMFKYFLAYFPYTVLAVFSFFSGIIGKLLFFLFYFSKQK